MMVLKQYKVNVVATAIVIATVTVEAKSAEDAHEIARVSTKPEDFEVREIAGVVSSECMEM